MNPEDARGPDCVVKPVCLVRLTRMDNRRPCATVHRTAYLVSMAGADTARTAPRQESD